MKILFPKNIFASLLLSALPEELKAQVSFKEASLLSGELEQGNADLVLLPSFDLLRHPQFYVSTRAALAFDGSLSNSYLYFIPDQKDFSDLFLSGDVSSNEIILARILFQEKYSSEIKIHLEAGSIELQSKNYLICGDSNLNKGSYLKALSFSDEISEMLFLPYVNYVFAARESETLERFHQHLNSLDETIEKNLDNFLEDAAVDEAGRNFIRENFSSIYFDMTSTEVEALKELLQLPYFHGITDEMIDLNLV